MVSEGRNGKHAAGRCTGLECLQDGIADQFLHGLFHGPRSECFVNAPAFKNSNATSEMEGSKPCCRRRPSNFSLSVRGKRLEDDFFIEAPDQFRAKKR